METSTALLKIQSCQLFEQRNENSASHRYSMPFDFIKFVKIKLI